MDAPVLQIHRRDNVAVALRTLRRGQTVVVRAQSVVAETDIPAKHKLALAPLSAGDTVIMYGTVVGRATSDIPVGGLLTTQNLVHDTSAYAVGSCAYSWGPPDISPWCGATFMGYHRSDGQIGTSNRWLVIPLVFCENRNVNALRSALEKELGYAISSVYRDQVRALRKLYEGGASSEELRRFRATCDASGTGLPRSLQNLDGIHFLTHEGGCGGTRQDARTLCGLFAGYLHHPNVAGATVLSLGCENAQLDILTEEIQHRNPGFCKPLLTYRQQDYATAHTMLTRAVTETFAAMVDANNCERRPAPLSSLTVGLECGGSDGFSGISANPAIGHCADLVVALGGKAILAEFPELCGVEQWLIDRCRDPHNAVRFAGLMESYGSMAVSVGSDLSMNPSPGNIRDGLLTDAMKSAGAALKGGTSPVTAVMDYPEYATAPGLNLLCTPGGDVESTTALAGAGAQVILFSTGLGTPTGNPVSSVIKISSNSELAARMPDIIDFDAGSILGGEARVGDVGANLLDTIVDVASGRTQTKADLLRQYDFIPWKRGVSL